MSISEAETLSALKTLRQYQEARDSTNHCGCGSCGWCYAISLDLSDPLSVLEEYVRISARQKWLSNWRRVIMEAGK